MEASMERTRVRGLLTVYGKPLTRHSKTIGQAATLNEREDKHGQIPVIWYGRKEFFLTSCTRCRRRPWRMKRFGEGVIVGAFACDLEAWDGAQSAGRIYRVKVAGNKIQSAGSLAESQSWITLGCHKVLCHLASLSKIATSLVARPVHHIQS
jgi:hypothetical protein